MGIGTTSPGAPLSIAGGGKESHPDTSMHLTNDCILFGGNNNGKEVNSAQIAAGKHVPNSLNILGMSSGTSASDRKINMWAEGGLTVYGNANINSTFLGNVGHGTDYAGVSHKDLSSSTNYALLQHKNGTTFLNASSGRNMHFRINNGDKMTLHSNGHLTVNGNANVSNTFLGDVGHTAAWAGFSHKDSKSTGGYALLQHTNGTTLLNSANGRNLHFRINNGDKMTLTSAGRLGIGTHNPTKGVLEVVGGVVHSLGGYGWLNRHGAHYGNGHAYVHYGVYAHQRIACPEFNSFSDLRIKDVMGPSNPQKDLATLEKIEIVDYQYKDKTAKGDKDYKKVIGQQVAEVYPQVVDKVKDEVVPDIMQKASMSKGKVSLTEHGLSAGDEVKIIILGDKETGEGYKEETYKVKSVSTDSFDLDTDESANAVFVYGRKVDDFHVVDYEGIAMLNVSATQALAQENRALKEEVQSLKEKNKALEDSMEQLKSDLAEIKAALKG